MSVSSDIKPVLTTDARISDIKDKLDVSALLGSRDNSFYSYSATTASQNSVNVTCSLPSESVVFDRAIFMSARVNFYNKIVIPKDAAYAPATNTPMFPYGKGCAFQQFPLNGLISNNNVKVNSVSFNMSQDDLQGVLLRTQDLNDLAKSNMCMSPSYPDQYLEFEAGQSSYTNSPLNSYDVNHFSSLVSRGAHPLESATYYITQADGTKIVDGSTDASLFKAQNKATDGFTYEVYFSVDFFEPLLLSPFIFSSRKMSKQGLTNVQNLTFNFTLDPLLRNVWCKLKQTLDATQGAYTIQLASKPFDNFTIHINALTPHITEVLPAISILPCHSWERYISSAVNVQTVASGASSDIILNNIVLSQVPEQIIVCVRKVMSSKSYLDANSFFKINSCSINFLNSQGMLSNCNDRLLYKISKENGYADTWYQWSGKANGAVAANGGWYPVTLNTSGSVLVINPAKDLSISSPYLTNGSRGNFNFQIKLNVTNNYSASVAPEVMVAVKNGCYMKCLPGGKSQLVTGYFDMSQLSSIVTEASEVTHSDLQSTQSGNISDASIGEIETTQRYEGSGRKQNPKHMGNGRVGGQQLKARICL